MLPAAPASIADEVKFEKETARFLFFIAVSSLSVLKKTTSEDGGILGILCTVFLYTSVLIGLFANLLGTFYYGLSPAFLMGMKILNFFSYVLLTVSALIYRHA